MLSDPGAWLLALHVIAFTAWMAAMFYLPRLMVYHADQPVGGETSEQFKIMERRLLKAIGTPSMVATLLLGLALATYGRHWDQGWLHGKLLLVLLLAGVHGVLAKHVRLLANDERPKSSRWYRVINEVPTVLFVLIVLLAVMKPF